MKIDILCLYNKCSATKLKLIGCKIACLFCYSSYMEHDLKTFKFRGIGWTLKFCNCKINTFQ